MNKKRMGKVCIGGFCKGCFGWRVIWAEGVILCYKLLVYKRNSVTLCISEKPKIVFFTVYLFSKFYLNL